MSETSSCCRRPDEAMSHDYAQAVRQADAPRWIPLPDPSPKIPDLEGHDFDWTDQAIEGRMPKFFLSYAPMLDRAS